LLQKEIDELLALQRNQRAHLKSYLEGQLIQLEQTGAAESVDSSSSAPNGA
jgi:hypothetical protein